MRAVKKNPVTSIVNSFFIDSPLPSNITYMWNFGSLLGATLVLQIATGIFLAMHYVPNTGLAFSSVEHIMRDVNNGWLIRYAHANGASMFFILIYLHVARGLYFGSYTKPRVMLWSVGVVILILLIVIAFLGYVKDRISPKGFKKEKKDRNSYFVAGVKNFNDFLRKSNESSINFKNLPAFIKLSKRGYSTLSEAMRNENSPEVTKFLNDKNLKVFGVFETLTAEETRIKLRHDLEAKSGIYLILNKISGDYYIGSASTSKFYTRFASHLIHGTGSKVVKNSVKRHGLSAFAFIVLEIYNPNGGGPVDRETNRGLLDLEDFYLKTLLPNYNILTEAGNSFGYRHTNITRIAMSTSYSEERRRAIGALNRGKTMPEDVRAKISIAKLGKPNPLTEKGLLSLCKKVKITNLDSTVWGLFPSIKSAAKALNCDRKTVRVAIKKNTNLKAKFKAYYI